MSIRRRLALASVLITVAGFAYLVRWVIADIRPYYLMSIEESLVDTTRILASLLSNKIRDRRIDSRDLHEALSEAYRSHFSASIYGQQKTTFDLRAYVTDDQGKVIFDSQGTREGKDYSRWNDVYLTLKGQYGARATRDDPKDPASVVIYVAAPILFEGRTAGVITLGRPIRSIDRFASSTTKRIIAGGVLAALTVVLLFLALTSWLTIPISRLTAYASDVREGRPAVLPQLGNNEIGRLGAAFDTMRTALENRKYVENYVASLTHELKSPVSGIRGAAELLEEEMPKEQQKRFLSNIQHETVRIQNLIDQLLNLSILENRMGLDVLQDADIVPLCRDAVGQGSRLAETRSLRFVIRLPETLPLRGDAYLLRQALSNLVQNAIEFSPEGGEIRIEGSWANAMVTVTVEDDGPGIPEFAKEKVFDRFFSLARPETGAKSSGLGLAITREVCRLHGGEVEVFTREGGGVTARLRLPALDTKNS